MSMNLFMQNVLQPLLPAAFGNGASAGSFTYSPDTAAISATGNLNTIV